MTQQQTNKQTDTVASSENTKRFHKLKKLSVTGDFDGDGERDTIYQHNFSHLTQMEIDSCPDPFYNEWDTVVRWFDRQDADVCLTFSKLNLDTLHLALGQGLYCLINIGDNNSDGKDEVALVIDYCDFSRLNSCKIFSICNSTWKQFKEFDINEGAFDFTSDSMPTVRDIKGFLIQRNKEWVYSDYHENGYDTNEDITKMKKLRLDKCQ